MMLVMLMCEATLVTHLHVMSSSGTFLRAHLDGEHGGEG